MMTYQIIRVPGASAKTAGRWGVLTTHANGAESLRRPTYGTEAEAQAAVDRLTAQVARSSD